MTNKFPKGKIWSDDSERSLHRTKRLRELISQYTQDTEEFSEVALEGEKPVIVQRTESDDMLIEIKATYNTGSLVGKSGFGSGLVSTSTDDTFSRVKRLIDDLDAPAVTTEEVASKIDCPRLEALAHLTELEHKGVVEFKKSGGTRIWWPVDDKADTVEDEGLDTLPEFVQEGLKKSSEDIQRLIEREKEEGESMDEAYERIRGNPDPEALRSLVSTDEDEESSMRDIINAKRESGDRKRELQNMFK